MKKRILPLILTVMMLFGLIPMASAVSVDEQSVDEQSVGVPTYTHLDVGVDGTLTVVSKCNGEAIDSQEVSVKISDVSATVDGYAVDDFYMITNPDGTQQWRSDLVWLDPNINTVDLTCTVTAEVNGQEISVPYTRHFNHLDLWHALYACPLHTGYDIGIVPADVDGLYDSITADVGFFTEDGGTINGDSAPVLYEDLLIGSSFPEAPTTAPDTYYAFDGWYTADAEGNATSDEAVASLPEVVPAGNTNYVAKWEKVSTPVTPVTPTAAAYQVEYYLQQENGGYALADTVTASAKLGSTVNAEIKSYDGYTYNAGVSVVSGEVVMPAANDKGGVDMLTLKVYYDLEKKNQPVNPSKPDQPADPSNPNQPADNGGATNPANGGNTTNANNTSATTGNNAAAGANTAAGDKANNNAVSPKTADSSMLYVSIALFAAAASGLVVLVLKRKSSAR